MDGPVPRLLAGLVTVTAVILVMWMELPPWQRNLISQMARLRTRQAAARLARAAGYRAMGRELAGTPEGQAGYDVSYRLSVMRDRL